MRFYLAVWWVLALTSCDRPSSPPAPAAKPITAEPAAPVAAVATPAGPAALPAGLRPLVPAEPLPRRATGEILLLSAKPGDPVVLKRRDGSQLEIRDGALATTVSPYALDGLDYDHDDLVDIIATSGSVAHTAQVVTRAEDTGGDVPHHEVWFVPTVATRIQLVADASAILVDWSDPQRRWVMVTLDEHAQLIDLGSGASQPIGDHVGSPSYAPDGTLYYRTLDGGAWRWLGDHGAQIGKGKRGRAQTGSLNDGIEPARYPRAVTFDKAGKPAFN